MIREWLRILVCLVLLPASTVHADRPPDIILIVSDDQGAGDIGCFGGDIPTPHLDRLAAGGARLTQWYVAAPVCTPSRFGIMTGRHPIRARNGLGQVGMILDARHRGRGFAPDEITLGDALRDAGYRTALVGKWHLGHGAIEHLPTRHGFDVFYGLGGGCVDFFTHRYGWVLDWYRGESLIDERGYATDLITDEAVSVIESTPADLPLFLVITYTAPHYGKSIEGAGANPRTLETRATQNRRVDPGSGVEQRAVNTLQARAGDLERIGDRLDGRRRHYAAMVMAMDEGIGRVLDALDRTERADSALVFFTPDHGADETASSAGSNRPFRGAKHSLYEGGVRVPAILRWPDRIEPGSEITAVAWTLDLMPTFCRIAGIETPGDVDGVPLVETWTGNRAAVSRTLFWKHGAGVAIRSGRYKLVGDELFDLEEDPYETTDVAESRPDVRSELETKRRAARSSYGD